MRRRLSGRYSSSSGMSLLGVFQNVECKTVVQFHAGGAEDGAQGARRSALFPDHLADVLVRDAKSYHRGIVVIEHLDGDILRLVNQRLDDQIGRAACGGRVEGS